MMMMMMMMICGGHGAEASGADGGRFGYRLLGRLCQPTRDLQVMMMMMMMMMMVMMLMMVMMMMTMMMMMICDGHGAEASGANGGRLGYPLLRRLCQPTRDLQVMMMIMMMM
jgi:hypothetical protein